MVASIETRTRSLLTPVPLAERERLRESAAGPVAHRRYYDELACLHEVQVARPPRPEAAGGPARVVAWNVERGRDVPALAQVLRSTGSGLVLLSEVDVGMARSGNRHTALDLAGELGLGCVFAVEFVELGLGGAAEREAHQGETNQHGLHGGAILSAAPLEAPAVVRLEHDGAWLEPERDEPRIGGRIAVVGTWSLGDVPITVAAVHLESHGDPEDRSAQLAELLDALESYAPGAPTIVGGDLNTTSLTWAQIRDPKRLKQALQEHPERLCDPISHEPLFEVAAARGYEWEPGNVQGEPTHRVADGEGSRRGGLKLDWFLTRGVDVSQPRVVAAEHPRDGHALSDHEAIEITCERRP